MQVLPSSLRTEPERSSVSANALDRGFGRMLEQFDAPAELLQPRSGFVLNESENQLLKLWQVYDYQELMEAPAQAAKDAEQSFERFSERAARINQELARYDVAHLLEIRFGVGGVYSDVGDRFELNDLFLGQLSVAEHLMADWADRHQTVISEAAMLGRPFALAKSALDIRAITGMSRLSAQAMNKGDYFAQQVWRRAFNLFGENMLNERKVLSLGVSPEAYPMLTRMPQQLDSVALSPFDPRSATLNELQKFANDVFRDGALTLDQYTMLRHGRYFLQQRYTGDRVNWIETYENRLSDLWLQSNRGALVESALAALTAVQVTPSIVD